MREKFSPKRKLRVFRKPSAQYLEKIFLSRPLSQRLKTIKKYKNQLTKELKQKKKVLKKKPIKLKKVPNQSESKEISQPFHYPLKLGHPNRLQLIGPAKYTNTICEQEVLVKNISFDFASNGKSDVSEVLGSEEKGFSVKGVNDVDLKNADYQKYLLPKVNNNEQQQSEGSDTSDDLHLYSKYIQQQKEQESNCDLFNQLQVHFLKDPLCIMQLQHQLNFEQQELITKLHAAHRQYLMREGPLKLPPLNFQHNHISHHHPLHQKQQLHQPKLKLTLRQKQQQKQEREDKELQEQRYRESSDIECQDQYRSEMLKGNLRKYAIPSSTTQNRIQCENNANQQTSFNEEGATLYHLESSYSFNENSFNESKITITKRKNDTINDDDNNNSNLSQNFNMNTESSSKLTINRNELSPKEQFTREKESVDDNVKLGKSCGDLMGGRPTKAEYVIVEKTEEEVHEEVEEDDEENDMSSDLEALNMCSQILSPASCAKSPKNRRAANHENQKSEVGHISRNIKTWLSPQLISTENSPVETPEVDTNENNTKMSMHYSSSIDGSEHLKAMHGEILIPSAFYHAAAAAAAAAMQHMRQDNIVSGSSSGSEQLHSLQESHIPMPHLMPQSMTLHSLYDAMGDTFSGGDANGEKFNEGVDSIPRSLAFENISSKKYFHPLYAHGVCRWPGCELALDDVNAFVK